MATTTKYDLLIKTSAEKNGIPPYVLWGLLSQESGFNPTARGYNKDKNGNVVSVDRGIAQINNSAHPDVSDAQADDPNFAIPWAARYLSSLSKQYGGNVVKYLTAYNAGHWSASLEYLGYAKKVLAKGANSPFAADPNYSPSFSSTMQSDYSFDVSWDDETPTTATDYSGNVGEYNFAKPVVQNLQDYWLDEYPEYRDEFDVYKLRLGDVVTHIPPEMIQVTTVNNVNQFMAMRQKESIKTKNGSEMTQVAMNFYFNGEDQINGYMLDAPEGGVYWMDGLRALLAQFKRMPFLPVENEFLNRTCGIYALAFSSVSVDTVEGFPGLLNVSCVFYEFDTTALLGFPSFMYDGMIMWPLFRWWYQQMLVGPQDDDSSTSNYRTGRSSTKLKRVSTPLEQDISFSVLNEQVLQANRNTIKNWPTNHDPNDPLKPSLERSYVPFTFVGDFVITNFNATFGNLLTPITLAQVGKPMFQYFGGLDTRIRLTIETSDENVFIQLRTLNETLEHYSRVYRNRFVGGYLRVKNDLINMMGVDFCMIEQLQVATTPGFPGHYTIELSLISFNKTQRDGEKLDGWNGIDTKNGGMPSLADFPGQDPKAFANFIIQEVRAERFLDSLELYPDLELPTYNHLNEQITLINAFRKKNRWPRLPITSLTKTHPQAVYVDPDFYMIYPDLTQYATGEGTDVLGVELDAMVADRSIKLERLVDIDAEGNKVSKEDGGHIETKTVTSKQKSWAAPNMTRGKWEGIKKKALTAEYLKTAWTYAPADNGDGLNPENYSVGYIRQQPGYEDLKHMMCYDAFKYSKRGMMLRAFPTFVFMIIDEGQWVNSRKIWNNYYAYHVVNNISVVRDRKNPADTAYVTMSNVYGALNYQSRPPYQQSEYIKKYGDSAIGEMMAGMHETYDYIYPSLEEESKKWMSRANLLTAGYLQAGARVHIRLGYGSCASDMPIVFNGVVTETDTGDEMTIICQGDGVELINSAIKADGLELNAVWEEGDTGQALIQYYLTKASNDLMFNATDRMAAALGRNSMYGIEHFGYVRQVTDTDFGDNFFGEVAHVLTGWSSNLVDPSVLDGANPGRGNMDPYDVVKNIYSTAGAAATSGVIDQNNLKETINTYLMGKAPWDVFKLMARIHTDYIVHPTYHNFHSTLFFGQPQWLCKQGWVLPEGASGETINDYKDFTKPYSQIHFLNGMEDIIHNGIKAVGADLITHCSALYYEGAGEKTGPTAGPEVWADQRIRPELQKTKIVDSTVVQSYVANWIWQWPFQSMAWLEGKVEYLHDEVANIVIGAGEWLGEEMLKLQAWISGTEKHAGHHIARKNARWNAMTRGAHQAVNFAISVVAESFKDMYQGSVMIIGDSAIKPYDIIYLNDFYTQMNGICEVQRVVHSMSIETGFVTEIVPDLAVAQIYGDTYIGGDPIVSSKTDGFKAGLEIGAAASVRAMRLMLGWMTLKAYNDAVRIGKNTLSAAKAVTKGETLVKAVESGKVAFSAAKELPAFAKMGEFFNEARVTLKSAITGVEVATMEGTLAMGPEVWVGLVIEAGIFVVVDMVIDEVLDWLNMDHNCIKIFPLYYKGHPYVAGISGHKNLIPGQQDEFMYGDPGYTLEGDPTGVGA